MHRVMHKVSIFNRTAAVLILLLMVGPAATFAQNSDALDVVITAARTEESELSTPAHVTVITAEEIQESGEQSLVGILDKLAGVNFTSFSGPQQAQIDMRGFGENSHGRVLVMVDGRRLNSQDMSGIQWLSIPLESIERVEVVHGSNSVMYGNHAVGGVVNIITKDSKEPVEFASTVDFGAYNSDQFQNGLFSSQRIRYGTNQGSTDGSVTFSHSTNEGHRERTESRSVNTLLNGSWDITEILRAEADLGYQWNTYQMPGALTEAQYESDPSQAVNDGDETEEHELSTFLTVEWFPWYNTELSLDGGYRYQFVAFDKKSWGQYSDRVYHTFEASPKIVTEGSTGNFPWQVVMGFDIYHSNQDIAQFSDKNRSNKNFSSKLRLSSFGGYLQPRLNFSDEVKIELGLRYEGAFLEGQKISADIDERDFHQAFVYDGALNYRPTKNIKVFAKGGTLFRYPFTDEQAAVAGLDDGFNSDLNPEQGVTAEIGSSLSVGQAVLLHLSGYFLQMEDEIAWYDPDGFGGTPGKNINQDKTRRWGVDAEIETQLHRRVGLTTSYSFIDARFVEGDNEDKKIPLVPSHSADMQLNIRPIASLSISPATSYRSESYKSGDNANAQNPIEQYWLFNLELSYAPDAGGGNMQIKVKAENLFDEQYVTFASYVTFSDDTYYPAPGRSISISASYSY
ncbi:MAG: TonB-dependent receptor [Spirochaetia bacterium]|nr:TonB-dependent receptor [Spirochaetia bacterium]